MEEVWNLNFNMNSPSLSTFKKNVYSLWVIFSVSYVTMCSFNSKLIMEAISLKILLSFGSLVMIMIKLQFYQINMCFLFNNWNIFAIRVESRRPKGILIIWLGNPLGLSKLWVNELVKYSIHNSTPRIFFMEFLMILKLSSI